MQNRIGIIYPTNYLPTIPSLVATINLLVENDYEIDLFTCDKKNISHQIFNTEKVKEYNLNEKYKTGTIMWKINYFFSWLPQIILKCKKRKYSILIGIDPWGLMLAGFAGKIARIPFAYFSLELHFSNEITSRYIKIVKGLERYYNRLASFTIIQDKERAELIRKENYLRNNAKIICLPNSSDGEVKKIKTKYLRDKFKFSNNKIVVLNSGSIHPIFMNIEVAQAARIWRNDLVLIFHTGRELNYKYYYIKEFLREIDNTTIFLNATQLLDAEYDEMVSSANIGLAFYKPISKNIYYMGLSSGKISKYLQCGLPVIVSDLPSLRKMVNEYKCGVSINDMNQLEPAIEKIMSDYHKYSENAVNCFNEIFYFRKHFSELNKCLMGLE